MRCADARQGRWCGYCYAGVRGRGFYKGHAGLSPRQAARPEDDVVQFIKRSETVHGQTPGDPAPDPQGCVDRFPAMYEFLTATAWDDGKKRVCGTAMVLAEGGRWKAWLHDRDGKRSCFVSAGSFPALFEACEDVLANGGGDWRSDKR